MNYTYFCDSMRSAISELLGETAGRGDMLYMYCRLHIEGIADSKNVEFELDEVLEQELTYPDRC